MEVKVGKIRFTPLVVHPVILGQRTGRIYLYLAEILLCMLQAMCASHALHIALCEPINSVSY